jgi:exopolysaccharide biosynthesis polyprenyl glycosylphosphotransferase
MISQRAKGFHSIFSVAQILICVLGYWLMLAVATQLFGKGILPSGNYIVYSILFAFGLGIEASFRFEGATEWYEKSVWRKHALALRQCAAAAGPVLFFLVATKDEVISRQFLFTYLAVLYAILFASSIYLPAPLGRALFRKGRLDRTLIIGSIDKAAGLVEWLGLKKWLGIECVGLLSDDPKARFSSLPVLGGTADLGSVIKQHEVSQVILAEFPFSPEYLTHLTEKCESLGVRFLVRSDLDERFRHSIIYMESDGLNFFGLREEPLQNPFNRVLKRLADIAVSLPVVVFILPAISAVVWLCQKWQSPGPLLYRQDRSGFQRGRFSIIKFRTMHVNKTEAVQASRGDPRIFPAGRWMRKLSIDELPQFINVLRGEMSVVGPRPHLPQHDTEFAKALRIYFVRSAVKPGITGLAQVEGFRGEAADPALIRGRILCDITYLENWSLIMDFWIIFRTFYQMFRPPPTAY